MKDASLSWLDEIPAHWKIIKVRRCLREHRQGYYTTDPYVDEGVRLLRITDLCDSGRVDYSESPFVEDRAEITPFLLQEFDFVFARTGGAGLFGMIEEVTEPLAYASYLIRFRFDGAAKPQFLRYFFLSSGFQDALKENIHGGVNQNVHAEDIKDQFLALPHIPEQRRIAAYLDEQTEKIDRLMDMRRRQMALLKEQRSALIQQAVTRGLNPNVPMKDSGLPWLGEIPEHWQVRRLKHLSPRQSVGLVINPSTYVVNEGVPFLFGGNISEAQISIDNVRRISPESNQLLHASRLNTGDLVTVRVGYPGVTAVITPELDQCNCASVLIIRRSKAFHSQWLCHIMNSRVGRYQVERVQYGAAQEQFNVSHAVDFVFPSPPIAEQHAIAEHIDEKSYELELLSQSYTCQLTLLTEYRAALIHECVTGQRLIPEAASL